jgi:hypothetical protein
MTLQRGRTAAGSKYTPPRYTPPKNTPRLRLKPKAPATGYVDGAWWPHSDDLPIELPDLLAVLSVRLGPIDRVIYKLTCRPADGWFDSPDTTDSRSTPSKYLESTATRSSCWSCPLAPPQTSHMTP